MKDPSPINYVYILYTLSAACLTYLNVSVTIRRKQYKNNLLLLLSRIGTGILTVGTMFDNLRTFLVSFPSAMYPKAVVRAANLTAANLEWDDLNHSGADFQVGVFWFCEASHIFLAAISCFTIAQFAVVLKTNDAPKSEKFVQKIFYASSVIVLVLFSFQLFAFITGPASSGLTLEELRDGILTVTASKKAPMMGLLAVFAYSFGMMALGCVASCKESADRRCKNIAFTFAVFLGLVLNGASGGAHGFLSVVGNFGEQLMFASVLAFDFSHNNDDSDDSGVYLEV
jgi:hypothetical protein